ncbi:CCA tRNA nucleotidyltransferase [Paenibacillus sp. ACRRX]|uniref:CCA tRNA nucleotidyltransferase n=1 Tax=Paenibacillus sp. ACRRX TaxID=2918206 RepID=UPI001EF6B95F|nr:CCA tRNA nucleotidyltransferase [Paenibacillus sp. ACRRX]MCG7406484.1 CCA tRNA nucleotidyltransferase [Paenibacillus sp. ACRRX]
MKLQLQGPLWKEAQAVICRLNESGYSAYMVGGCVRDTLLGRPIHDVDIATSALPDEVAALFDRVIPTGIAHGTVTVLMGEHTYEVTTFRRESAYADYRRPEHVEYITDLTEDLERRDFTINAMALAADGSIIDPFGGQQDLISRNIRCVGSARERLNEDALRMLRGIRFASVLNMRMTKSTWRAIRETRSKLKHIAMERIRDELWKLLAGPYPARGWAMVVRSCVLAYVKEPVGYLATGLCEARSDSFKGKAAANDIDLTVIESGAHDQAASLQQPSSIWNALGQVTTPELRMAVLALSHRASLEEAAQVLAALRLSGAQQDAILGVLHAHALLAQAAIPPAACANVSAAEDGAAALRRAVAQAVLAYGETAVRGALACGRAWLAASDSIATQRVDDCAAPKINELPPQALVDADVTARIGGSANSSSNKELTLPMTSGSCSDTQPTGSGIMLWKMLLNEGDRWIHDLPVRQLKDLAISGKDVLKRIDRPAGPWVRACLEGIWLDVALGIVDNNVYMLQQHLERKWGAS